ncbi:RNB domain-containing ribonuclease [Psittacicella gerlachiana]|uniref:RNB domain-containing protein n=1 Tax=Psittacicella gerlachiana TaxID=2028574 RepID=A0A3A1YGC6_9GAMM|nr:RNB domain-containing ribonuclease [Psittacicella gerlachiana]RIY35264.1 hypothetical protein CKF59_03890 [Psittacicella gerlachiana]
MSNNQNLLLELKKQLAKDKQEIKNQKNNKKYKSYEVFLHGKKHYITNDHTAKDPSFNCKNYSVCDCDFIRELKNFTFNLCDGKICSCVHDNKHRVHHNLVVGLIRTHEKGFGFIDCNSNDVFVPHSEIAKVLDQCTVSYTIGENKKGKVAHLKNVIDHPYTRYPAEIISLAPLKIKLRNDPLKRQFKASADQETTKLLNLNSIVLVTVDNINALLENSAKEITFTIDDYVCETGNPLAMWYEELLKHQLPIKETVAPLTNDEFFEQRINLNNIPFISIDSETTEDIDDVLFAYHIDDKDIIIEKKDNTPDFKTFAPNNRKILKYNFNHEESLNSANLHIPEETQYILAIGIADPSSFFAKNSLAENRAKQLLQTYYLPAYTLGMLPNNITKQSSLLEGQIRPSIVGFIYFDANANFTGVEFKLATLQNHAKLNYNDTSDYLQDRNKSCAIFEGHKLAKEKVCLVTNTLNDFYLKRKNWRNLNKRNVTYSTSNTQYVIDEHGKCIDIIPIVLKESHELVSECMLCYNHYTALYFKHFNIPGIYTYQSGIKEVNKQYFNSYIDFLYQEKNITALEAFKNANENDDISLDSYHNIKEIVLEHNKIYSDRILRFMNNSEYALEPKEHFGLGLEAYINATSPIRRYVDVINQRLLKAFITNNPFDNIDTEILSRIDESKNKAKAIYKTLASELETQYLEKHLNDTFVVEIASVIQSGMRVKDTKTGIVGFIYLNRLEKSFNTKFKINSNAMEFTVYDKTFTIGSHINAKLQKIDGGKFIFNWHDFNNLKNS